jgi:succinate dehydrogenase / fumarate reductase flavoprotein subunit
MKEQPNQSCDVLVIGGGSAGLRAAIEAHDQGVNVLIISKSKTRDPHTVLARGGINAALGTMDPQDNWMVHAADTLKEGEFLADYERVEILCRNAPEAVNELVRWGARFHRETDGRLTQRFFGAHTYRRTVFYQDWTGQEMIRVLMQQIDQRNIPILDNIYITKLLKTNSDGEICGALGIDIGKREIFEFKCKSLVLAAGGYTRVYSVSSSRSFENYGEGIALAFEAGADLVDMEMVQFHPTGMVWPEKALGTLATEAIRGEGGILLNSKDERFMKNYYPERMELGPRDVVARAIYNEIISGRGTKHGGVWLDVTHLSKERIMDRLPTMYEQFKTLAGVDISTERMEVGPTAHYSMGGVAVDAKCRTKVSGLIAVGEVMSQIHGANRLGGNSLLDTMVFGKIAGAEAATLAKERSKIETPTQMNLKNRSDLGLFIVDDPISLRNKMQEIMVLNAGIVKNRTKLEEGLAKILELKNIYYKGQGVSIDSKNPDYESLNSLWQVKSSLFVCETIIRSALNRQESRGAHFRADFPKIDDVNWKVNIFCRKNGEQIELYKRNVKEVSGSLAKFLKEHTKAEHQREFE